VLFELQVRSILEDAWAEWDHQLFYKPPRGLSEEVWQDLSLTFGAESRRVSDSLFEVALKLDRLRDMFAVIRPVPEFVGQYISRLQRKAPTKYLDRLVARSFGSKIRLITANLRTGLTSKEVSIKWDPHNFVGLELAAGAESDTEAQRFDFDKLTKNPAKLRLSLPSVGQGKAAEKALDKHFCEKAAEFLKTCYELKPFRHRTFFNEYSARLDSYGFDHDKPFETVPDVVRPFQNQFRL